MTVQNLYTQYLDGKITESKFLYEVRRDQNLDMISPSNSFNDVVKILKNKSIISEKAHKEAKQSEGKQDVEVISKTIDMVNPYEYAKGMNYELEIMDVPASSGNLENDNVLKAQKKVLANLTKNPQFYCEKLHGKGEVSDEWVEVTKKEIDKIGKGKSKVLRESEMSDRVIARKAISVYDKGENLYKQGQEAEAEALRQQAIEIASEIGLGEAEFSKYQNHVSENTETIDKYTRYDVTLKNGKHFSGVKFINRNSFNTANGGSYINQEIAKVTPTDEKLRENLGHNETSSIHQEGNSWVVTYRSSEGDKEKIFPNEEDARKFYSGLDENYFSNYGQDDTTYEEDETEADKLYDRGYQHFMNGAKDHAEKFRQQAIQAGQITHQDEEDFPRYDGEGDEGDTAEYDEFYEGEDYETTQKTNWTKVVQALAQVGDKEEIRQYLTSLHQSGDTFNTVDDFVEDFRNYIADKSLEESFNLKPHTPPNVNQLAVYERYSKETGIPIDNLMAMVREAKEKMEEAITAKTGDAQHDSTTLQKINKVTNPIAKSELQKAFQSGKTIDV